MHIDVGDPMEIARLPCGNGRSERAKEGSKEFRLSELLTHADLTDKLDDMSKRGLLEYALDTVHKQAVGVNLTHHYIHEVVIAFTGDSLFLVDQSIPLQEIIDTAVKSVNK
jgi:hypothetical protein